MHVDLIVIDGQNDFLDTCGSLRIPNADVEARRLKEMIWKGVDAIDSIRTSLDVHHLNDGSHNIHWMNENDESVDPFTIITHDDVLKGKYYPTFSFGMWNGAKISSRDWALNYTKSLEEKGRTPLCLWPVHCQFGTWGSNLYQPIKEAFDYWCQNSVEWVDFIIKGDWAWTEHYSAIQADVPDITQSSTCFNYTFADNMNAADKILWAGWAGSHCFPWTVKDSVDYFEPSLEEKSYGAENEFVKKCILLEDACAPVPNPHGDVPNFSKSRQEFLDEMESRGAIISTTTEVLNLL